jgi:hypothetical protein
MAKIKMGFLPASKNVYKVKKRARKTRTEKQDAAIDKALEKRLVDSGMVSAKAFTMSKKSFAKRMARLQANR